MNDVSHEVRRELHSSQAKHIGLLMALAVSAIAFAVQRTSAMPLSWYQVPLGLAVLTWCMSFWCGYQNRMYYQSFLYANVDLLRVQSGNHPDCPPDNEHVRIASEGMMQAVNSSIERGQAFARWQFRLIAIGGLLFITWHIIEMKMRMSDV